MYRREDQLHLTLAIELPHTRDRRGYVMDGALNGLQILAALCAEIRFFFQKRIGVKRHRRDGIVDVMSDAARHLPERTQAFVLHDGLLSLAQFVVSRLEGTIELRLMRGERDVLAQLPQEFAFAAA